MNTTHLGDIAELAVAADLVRRGYRVAFPFGVSHDYDLILSRVPRSFELVQIKYATPKNGVIPVRSRSHSNTSKGQTQKSYTAEMIDWIAVFDGTNIYYVPSTEISGALLHLRLTPTKNGNHVRQRYASDYTEI